MKIEKIKKALEKTTNHKLINRLKEKIKNLEESKTVIK